MLLTKFYKRENRFIEIMKFANSWLNDKLEFKPISTYVQIHVFYTTVVLLSIINYYICMVEEAAW